jgi:prolyl-tRNA editing enzyme YbaK/EbsC (Cys-tRNA(Pro) deacylase)
MADLDSLDTSLTAPPNTRPDGFRRVAAALAGQGHPHPPLWLDVAARTAQEAADALGVTLGQIAKSVVFRLKADDSAVLVITSGDRRVDEARLKVHTGALGRADADFVKARTGFSIGGVSPAGFAPADDAPPPRLFIDRELFRFDIIWAAAGHPNGVFKLTPAELQKLTGAPVIDVVQA